MFLIMNLFIKSVDWVKLFVWNEKIRTSKSCVDRHPSSFSGVCFVYWVLKSGKQISKTLPTKSETRDWLQQKRAEAEEALDVECVFGEHMHAQLWDPASTVSYILGHSQPSTTLNMYGHQFSAMELQAACLVDDIFAGAQPSPLPAEFLSAANLKKWFSNLKKSWEES